MSVVVNSKTFNQSLKKVSHAIRAKTIIPILENVKILCDNNVMTVVGSDMNLVIKCSNECQGEKFDFLMPFKDIYNLTSTIAEQPLTISKEDNKIVVKAAFDNDIFKFGFEDESIYPQLPEFNMDNAFDISAEMIYQMEIASKSLTNSTEIIQEWKKNISLYVSTGNLTIVGVDGFQCYVNPNETNATIDAKILISPVLIPAIKSFKNCKCSISDNHILFFDDNLFISQRIVEGIPVDYNQAIPERTDNYKIGRSDLISTIKKILSISSISNYMIIDLIIEKDKTVFNYVDDAFGKEVKLNVNSESNTDLDEISFNAAQLLSVVERLHPSTEKVLFSLTAFNRGALILSDKEDGNKFMLMPLNNKKD